MNWISQLERRRRAVLTLLLLMVVAFLAGASLREEIAYDSYWHLKMGQDWIESGLSPFEDHYSITHYGGEIHNPPFLFQVALYGMVELAGVDSGFKIMTFISMILVLVLTAVWFRQIRAPLIVICLTLPLLAMLLQDRALVRPELFSYPLLIFSLILYEKARVNPGPKIFLAIALTMLFWTNFHASVLGYVIFFGLFIDLGVRQIRDKDRQKAWLAWGAWGLLIVAVGFIRPGFTHPVLQSLSFSPEWAGLIKEYRSPVKGAVSVTTLEFIFLFIATILLLLREKLFGYLVVCAVMGWYGLRMGRMLVPSGLVVLSLFAMTMSRLDMNAIFTKGPRIRRWTATAAVITLFVAPVLAGMLKARSMIHSNRNLIGYFPDHLVTYMKAQGMHGRIFNDYEIGGYLIYHLTPDSRVYIDGRTGILYPLEHAKRWMDAMRSTDVLQAEIEDHGIDYAILANQPMFMDLVEGTGLMQLDFVDLRYSLYTRGGGNFPISGRLWRKPWCWNPGMQDRLNGEFETATTLLPPYSPVMPVIRLARDFMAAPAPSAFLSSLGDYAGETWSDATRRFAAYRALDERLNEMAAQLFFAVERKELKDYLAGALANIRTGDLDFAETILDEAARINWGSLEFNEVRIMHHLLLTLQGQRPLTKFQQSYIDNLGRQVSDYAIPVTEEGLQIAAFCDVSS